MNDRFIKRTITYFHIFWISGMLSLLVDAIDHAYCGIVRGIPLIPIRGLYGCKPLHEFFPIISFCIIIALVFRFMKQKPNKDI